jgi:hypothetical protein
MSEHTPGPWYAMTNESGGLFDQANVFSEHDNSDGEPTFIADTLGVDDEIPLEERKANARLIAAALDMLHALEMVRDANKTDPHIPPAALATIEAAIAKARGAAHA